MHGKRAYGAESVEQIFFYLVVALAKVALVVDVSWQPVALAEISLSVALLVMSIYFSGAGLLLVVVFSISVTRAKEELYICDVLPLLVGLLVFMLTLSLFARFTRCHNSAQVVRLVGAAPRSIVQVDVLHSL